MNDRALSVLEQYELKVENSYRGRGVLFCETDQGLMVLQEYRGSEAKLEKLWQLLSVMREEKVLQTDLPVRNREGSFAVKDEEENRYVLKAWIPGRECDPRSEAEACQACETMGSFHRRAGEIWSFEDDKEKDRLVLPDLQAEMEKRCRELKKIRSFIRTKQQKNDFENYYLRIIPEYLSEAEAVSERLKGSGYARLRSLSLSEGRICHGEYTQHNVLLGQQGIVLTNFEHAGLDLQLSDLALFLRKIMEKQNWRIPAGEHMLSAYERVRPMTEQEREVLGLRLLFPEKLWKLANHYYHTNKAWIPAKDMEKLKVFVKQQNERRKFIRKLLRVQGEDF